jgi:hypothetical protein
MSVSLDAIVRFIHHRTTEGTTTMTKQTADLAQISAHHAATGLLMTEALIARMRVRCDDDLVHYAGAAHRDPVAWQMCIAYLATPNAPESELKARALRAAGWR